MSLDWKQRIRNETGMSYVEAFTALAKRRHSQKGIAKIFGIGTETLRRHTKGLDIPWCNALETVEYWEAKQNQAPSERRVAHIKECHKRKTANALHIVDGVSGTIESLCDHFKTVSARTARRRIKDGMSVSEAILTKSIKKQNNTNNHVWRV